jgi:pimeloyl-ACP methyl ester carboxylesterase
MLAMPLAPLFIWLLGLLSLALLGGGVYLLWAWYVGVVVGTVYLVAGAVMIGLTFTGRLLVLLCRRPGSDEPADMRTGTVQRIARPDGTELQVECYGPVDGQPLIFLHGNGTNSTEWYYAKQHLATRFRLILCDLPGVGKSRGPTNRDYDLEKLAGDLEAMLGLAGNAPVILVGHSLGGMIILTFCRRFPRYLQRRVAGLVLVDTTYTNPVRTTSFPQFFQAIQRPLLEPLLHLMIWLSPLVWLMNWLGYLNGSAHVYSALTGFAGSETRGQLDFTTRLNPQASPAVLARKSLAMLRYDATLTLPTIDVPVLVLAGHLDRVTVPEASAYMSEVIPHNQLVKLAPGGHMAHMEQNERFTQLVGEFAAGCASRADSVAPAEQQELRRRSS